MADKQQRQRGRKMNPIEVPLHPPKIHLPF